MRFYTAGLSAAMLLLGVATASASVSGSGTVSPASTSLTYHGGTYTVSNPTPAFSSAGGVQFSPTCDDNICDRFELTVANVPDNYALLHPNDLLTFRVGWPNASADFDLWVYDSSGTTVLTKSASSSNPEVATLPILAGTTKYEVRVVPFTVTGDTFDGTIGLGTLPLPEGLYGNADHVVGTDIFSCNTHLTGVAPDSSDHGRDAEPAVKFDPDGVANVTSNGNGGIGYWKVADACGKDFTFMGVADLTNGGGDTDIEIATARNANGFYNIYTSSLHRTDVFVNINSGVSYDGGKTFMVTPVSDPTPVNDRNWSASYAKDIVYLSYRTLNTGNQQFVVRAQATEGQPLVFGPATLIYTDPNVISEAGYQVGNMVTDKRPAPLGTPSMHAGVDGQGNVYHGFTTASGAHVYVAVSRDFGVTWKDTKVFDAPPGTTFGHIFTWVAVDAAGNVYTCFSSDHDVYYSVSSNIKTLDAPTWSKPVRVSDGPFSKSSALPSIAAGSAGRVVFTWYGSPTTDSQAPLAQWRVFHARCANALDALVTGGVPRMEQVTVSDHIVHEGALCQGGTLGCSGNTRALLDDFEIDVSPVDGSTFLTYTDDGPIGGTYIARQLYGPSAIAGVSVLDRTVDCPVAADFCAGAPEPPGNSCDLPGFRVVADGAGDAGGNFGSPQTDISKIFVSEPQRGDGVEKITFTMKVGSLDPANLPLNNVWRMFFTVPTSPETTFFVSMNTCRPTQLPGFDFGFINDGANGLQSGLGTADSGGVTPDGSIQVTMSKHRVGNNSTAGDVLFHADIGSKLRSIRGTTYFLEGANCTGLLETIDETGTGSYTVHGNCPVAGVGPGDSKGSLAMSARNPFRGRVEVSYALPRTTPVRITVYGVTGQRVCTLLAGEQAAGVHQVPFDLDASAGHRLGPGVYLVRLEAGGEQRTLRLIGLR